MNNKRLYCLVGASGSGKTTLAQYLKKDGVVELVSHTTRKPREKDGEVHGIHYYFITDEEFDKLEKIEESPYAGEYRYCLSVDEVEGKFENYDRLFAIVDLNGANQVKDNCKNRNIDVKMIYIQTDLEVMRARMEARGDSEENIVKRLNFAQQSDELANGKYADYIIDNRGSLEESVNKLLEIVR